MGAGYQIIQSKIAIGSGGLFGKGFLQGSQSYLDYLPEKHTDFIFTLFSEEFGFFGSLFILFLYAIIVWRIVKIGNITRSTFLLRFWNCVLYICSSKYDDGSWAFANSWISTANYVLWRIIYDGHNVRIRDSNVLQSL